MPRILAHNWEWKLASVLLALVLWWAMVGDVGPEMTREVPLEIRLQGTPADGYRVGAREVTPDRVRITGPGKWVKSLTSATTEPIDISGRDSTLEVMVDAGVADERVKLETPERVTVKVNIEKGSASKE